MARWIAFIIRQGIFCWRIVTTIALVPILGTRKGKAISRTKIKAHGRSIGARAILLTIEYSVRAILETFTIMRPSWRKFSKLISNLKSKSVCESYEYVHYNDGLLWTVHTIWIISYNFNIIYMIWWELFRGVLRAGFFRWLPLDSIEAKISLKMSLRNIIFS